jgi:hypothetical protein
MGVGGAAITDPRGFRACGRKRLRFALSFLLVEGTATMARTLRRLLLRGPAVLVLAGLPFLAHCSGQSDDNGPSCSKLCERGQEQCPGLPRVDCDGQCFFEDARAQRTGCDGEVDAVTRCSAELADICTTATACAPQLGAFRACLAKYCAKHPTSQDCQP